MHCKSEAHEESLATTSVYTEKNFSVHPESSKTSVQTSNASGKLFCNIPQHIRGNKDLARAIEYALPKNYNFEIYKTLWRIEQDVARHVGLQFPEGLLMFASEIASILQFFSSHTIDVTILGDVTYGACCVDDITARRVGVDLLVHYGHSCLVPMSQLSLRQCLYVFVDIVVDFEPLLHVIRAQFEQIPGSDNADPGSKEVAKNKTLFRRLALMGTIQYSSMLHTTWKALAELYGERNVIIPQALPLTSGEVLGCTSPNLMDTMTADDVAIFVADGRFHLESAMIQNPHLRFFRYDPFTKKLFREVYDYQQLHANREAAIAQARGAGCVGIILGTLGRQGSVGIFERLRDLLESRGLRLALFLMSEISPDRLKQLATGGIQAFVQVGCPRLSLDWGHCVATVPLLTPYEAFVTWGGETYRPVYPMDFYAHRGGPWTNYQQPHRDGSLARVPTSDTSFSDLEKRRALIRQRAEARRRARATT